MRSEFSFSKIDCISNFSLANLALAVQCTVCARTLNFDLFTNKHGYGHCNSEKDLRNRIRSAPMVLTVATDKSHSHAVSQNGILRQISSVVAVVIRANRFPFHFYFLKQFHRTRSTSIAFARRRNRCRNENHMPYHIDMTKSYLQHLFPVHQHFVTDSKAEQMKLQTKIEQPKIADRERELEGRLLTSKRTLKLHFIDDDLLVKCRF